MTLIDTEKGETIINPFIIFQNHPPESDYKWAAVNTTTFGEDGQQNLLSIFDEETQKELEILAGGWFKISAVVGKQNLWRDYNRREDRFKPRTVGTEGPNDAIAIVPLGFLPKEFVKEHYEWVYRFLKESSRS